MSPILRVQNLNILIEILMRKVPKFLRTEDALKNHSSLGSLETPANCDSAERKKLKRTQACFEFQSCLDLAAEDEENIDMLRTVLRDIDSKLQSPSVNTEEQSQAHRADKFLALYHLTRNVLEILVSVGISIVVHT